MENQQPENDSRPRKANPPGDQGVSTQLESEDMLKKLVDADTSTSTSSDYMGPPYNHRVSDPYEMFDGIFARAEEQGMLDEVLTYYGMTRDDITPTRRRSRAKNEAIERGREPEDRRVATGAPRAGLGDFGPRSPLWNDDAIYTMDAIKESNPPKSLEDLKGKKPDKGGQRLLVESTASTQVNDSLVLDRPQTLSNQVSVAVHKRGEPSSDTPAEQSKYIPVFAGNPPLGVNALHRPLTPRPVENLVQKSLTGQPGASATASQDSPQVASNQPHMVDTLQKPSSPALVQGPVQDAPTVEYSGDSALPEGPLNPPIAESPPTSSPLPLEPPAVPELPDPPEESLKEPPPPATHKPPEPPNPDLSSYLDPPEDSPKFPSSLPDETRLPGYFDDPPEYPELPQEHVALAAGLLQAAVLVGAINIASGIDAPHTPAANAIEPPTDNAEESPSSDSKELNQVAANDAPRMPAVNAIESQTQKVEESPSSDGEELSQVVGIDAPQMPAVNAVEPANNEVEEVPQSVGAETQTSAVNTPDLANNEEDESLSSDGPKLVWKDFSHVNDVPQTPELEVAAAEIVPEAKPVDQVQQKASIEHEASMEEKATPQEAKDYVPLEAHESWYSPDEEQVIPEKKKFFSGPGLAVLGASAVGVAASILAVAFLAVPWWKRMQLRKKQAKERVENQKLTTRRLHARHWRHQID